MDKCRHHPDRDACVLCQKMEVAYCQECLDNCKACTDPCLYCKFRPSCVIWELCRKEAKKRCKDAVKLKYRRERLTESSWWHRRLACALQCPRSTPKGGQCPPYTTDYSPSKRRVRLTHHFLTRQLLMVRETHPTGFSLF